jgi:hypothetical protein
MPIGPTDGRSGGVDQHRIGDQADDSDDPAEGCGVDGETKQAEVIEGERRAAEECKTRPNPTQRSPRVVLLTSTSSATAE